MAVLTPAEAKTIYPTQWAPTGMDTYIATIIGRADQLIAIACKWPQTAAGTYTIESANHVLYPAPSAVHRRALDLGVRWTATISEVAIDETWAFGTAVSSGDYSLDLQTGLLWLSPSSTEAWSTEARSNRVTLTMGYASGTAPEAIKAAVAQQARYLHEQSRLTADNDVLERQATFTPEEAETLLAPGVRDALLPLYYWPAFARRAW